MLAVARSSIALVALAVGSAGSVLAQRPAAAGSGDRVVWPDEGPRTWEPRPTETAITANDLRTRLYQFADDSMRGRRMGEPGNYKGTEYIASEFRRLGLRPAGDNGTYFQVMPFGPIGFDSSAARLIIAGRALRTSTDWIPLRPSFVNGAGPGADVKDVAAVYAGTWGDTTVALDSALFHGRVAVFSAAPAQFGGGAPRPPVSLPSCADLPDRFGADAAIADEARLRANPSLATARRRPTAPGGRDDRAQRAGAVALLVIGLDEATPAVVRGAFAAPMGMRPTPSTSTPAVGQAVISGQHLGGNSSPDTLRSISAPECSPPAYQRRR